MRASFLIAFLAGTAALQGCTVLAIGTTADLNRQRRVAATVYPDALTDSLFVPGDSLTIRLANGRTVRGTFAALPPDSLRLDTLSLARTDIDRVERSWMRASAGQNLFFGFLADAAVFFFVSQSFSLNFSNSRL